MLYLFGRLALSDSLAYHEDVNPLEFAAASAHRQHPTGSITAAARAAVIGRRLRRSRHFPQASRAAK